LGQKRCSHGMVPALLTFDTEQAIGVCLYLRRCLLSDRQLMIYKGRILVLGVLASRTPKSPSTLLRLCAHDANLLEEVEQAYMKESEEKKAIRQTKCTAPDIHTIVDSDSNPIANHGLVSTWTGDSVQVLNCIKPVTLQL